MEKQNEMRARSQALRKAMTKEENKLWYQFLRKYPLQFKRQYMIGNYIVDFYCYRAMLIVELDGSQHYDPENKQKDTIRTGFMEKQGYRVLRYSNLDVLQRFNEVCQDIDRIARSRAEKING